MTETELIKVIRVERGVLSKEIVGEDIS